MVVTTLHSPGASLPTRSVTTYTHHTHHMKTIHTRHRITTHITCHPHRRISSTSQQPWIWIWTTYISPLPYPLTNSYHPMTTSIFLHPPHPYSVVITTPSLHYYHTSQVVSTHHTMGTISLYFNIYYHHQKSLNTIYHNPHPSPYKEIIHSKLTGRTFFIEKRLPTF